VPHEIVERIERELGVPGLAEMLAARLAPTDLQSLLLEVARRRAAATRPADILRRYATDRFVRPAAVDPGRLQRLAQRALDVLPAEYEQIQLSPMCPLGTSSSLGGISQDWVVSTVRGGEIVSDPTSVLALECALRRRRDRTRPVRLSATHRVLRAQSFEPPFTQHFGLLALCVADRAGSEDALLIEHVDVYRRFLEALGAGAVTVDREPRKPAYYTGATFGVSLAGTEVVEGGFVDWTQRLLGDRKERLLTSAVGLDLLAGIIATSSGSR
jgi:hypothetical protein